MKDNEAVYVCMRVADMPVPYVPCLKGKCKSCGQEVYYSKYVYENDRNIKQIVDSGNLLCVQCVKLEPEREPAAFDLIAKEGRIPPPFETVFIDAKTKEEAERKFREEHSEKEAQIDEIQVNKFVPWSFTITRESQQFRW